MPVGDLDPILQQRARIANYVAWGNKIGYGLLLLSCVGFVWLKLGSGSSISVIFTTTTMIIGCIILLPTIILGYAVKAAARHDRELAAEAAAKKAATSANAVGQHQ
jgi:ABC-type tungstate transport system substrate-binding protein